MWHGQNCCQNDLGVVGVNLCGMGLIWQLFTELDVVGRGEAVQRAGKILLEDLEISRQAQQCGIGALLSEGTGCCRYTIVWHGQNLVGRCLYRQNIQ